MLAQRKMTAPTSIAALAFPLDVVRAALLRLVGRWGRIFLADRSARVALHAAIGLVVSLSLACLSPLWAFALGPIVLGIPHLLADVRYLIVRPRLHERRALVVSVGVPILVATVVQSPALGIAASAGAVLFATGDRIEWSARRVALLAGVAGASLAAALTPRTAALALLHGHNAIAVVVFLVAFARSRKVGAAIAIAMAVAAIALVAGVFDPILAQAVTAAGPRTGLSFGGMLDILAPNVKDPVLAMRVAVLFVFAQGFHYVVWLRAVPEDARERPGVRSFQSSVAALERDLGIGLVVVAGLLALALLVRASSSLEAARLVYLRASGFHGYLEIAFLSLWLAARGRR